MAKIKNMDILTDENLNWLERHMRLTYGKSHKIYKLVAGLLAVHKDSLMEKYVPKKGNDHAKK